MAATSQHTILPGFGNAVIVSNPGASLVFVRLSPESVPVATAADIPILPAQKLLLSNPVPNGPLGVAAIPAASLGTAQSVYFTGGEGGNTN